MTLDEIRDELARMDGCYWDGSLWRDRDGDVCCDHEGNDEHPYPPALDAAAAALPEGWTPFRRNEGVWRTTHIEFGCVAVPDTGNEIYDRFRLALEARRAMEVKA